MKNKKDTGNLGEDLAAQHLKKHGYKILERNLKNYLGEIDILAVAPISRIKSAIPLRPAGWRGFAGLSGSRKSARSDIVIVEVKTKSGRDFGEGFEMVNFYKQRKLLALAKQLQTDYPNRTIRIDVVSVDTSCDPPEIKHFENAVEEN